MILRIIEIEEDVIRLGLLLIAYLLIIYTGRSDNFKNTAQIALKLTKKKTNKRHQVKIFILYCQLLPDLAQLSDVSFISHLTISSFLPINI